MESSTTFTDELIQTAIVRAVQNVCRTMFSLEAGLGSADGEDSAGTDPGGHYVFGSVGFIGEVNGLVYLGIPDSFASAITAQILGMTPGEVESHGHALTNDVIGEFTNMTAGGFKNALCDLGFPCKLTLPSIVRGENVSVVANKGVVRHQFLFNCDGQQLIVDVQFKND